MTRMIEPDCAVMCNFINTHAHTHTRARIRKRPLDAQNIAAGEVNVGEHP